MAYGAEGPESKIMSDDPLEDLRREIECRERCEYRRKREIKLWLFFIVIVVALKLWRVL
jgi:hypothetical protein